MAQTVTREEIIESMQASIKRELFPKKWRVVISWTGGCRYEYCDSFAEAAQFVAHYNPPQEETILTLDEEIQRGFKHNPKNFTQGD